MGFVRYCYACQGPIQTTKIYIIKDIKSFIIYLNSIKKKNIKAYNKIINMMYSNNYNIETYNNIFKLMAKTQISPFKEEGELYKQLKSYFKLKVLSLLKYKWLSKIILLHKNNTNINITIRDNWDGEFLNKNKEYYVGYNVKPKKESDGIIIHNDCYKLLSNKYGKFKYSSIKFGQEKVNNYNTQDYSWLMYFINKDEYLLESPLKNNKHKQLILKKKFNIDITKKLRPSPSESATIFKVGTKKKGNDKNIWIIVINKDGIKRWKKIN